MKNNNWKQKLAKSIEKKALYSARESVGKSYPSILHEVEVPEALKNMNLDDLKLDE